MSIFVFHHTTPGMLMQIRPESVPKTLTNEVVIDFGIDGKSPKNNLKKTINLYISINHNMDNKLIF